MTILPCLNILKKYLSHDKDIISREFTKILFNENLDILLTKNYLEFIENNMSDEEQMSLESLIIELSDTSRLSERKTDSTESEIYESLYELNKDQIDSLFSITYNYTPSTIHFDYNKIDKSKFNKEYLLYSLLMDSSLILKYFNFTKDIEIQNAIKNLFELPHKISRIYIYNRQIEATHLSCIKNKSIYYYNLSTIYKPHQRKVKYLDDLSNAKNDFGRNIKLFSTNNKKLIHERKILFNHISITFDNSLNYTLINEPNWQISIEIDRKKTLINWTSKNNQFYEWK